jgi:uncharacterized protein with HEPN domain
MLKDDQIRLRHMLDAATEVAGFIKHRQRHDLDRDRLLVLGLMKSIEIIGEAASRLSPVTRNEHPAIPWSDMAGMRNRLVHVYFETDIDLLWETVSHDLPALAAELRKALEPDA